MEDGQLSEVEALKKRVAQLEQQNRTIEQQNNAFQEIEHELQHQLELVCDDYAKIQPRFERYVLKFGELSFDDLPQPEVPPDPTGYDHENMLRVRNRALGDSCIKLQDEIKNLQAQLEEERKKKSQISLDDIRRIRAQVAAMSEENKRYAKALAQAKELINSLTKQNEELRSSQDSTSATDMQSGISVDLIKNKDKQIQDMMQQIADLNQNNTMLLEKAHGLQTDLDTTQQSLADAKSEFESNQQRLKEMYDSDLAKRTSEIDKIRKSFETTKQSLESKIAELISELAAVKKDLTESNQQVSEYRSQIEDLIKYKNCCNSISEALKTLGG